MPSPLLLAAALEISVLGDSSCPTPAAVERELARLLPKDDHLGRNRARVDRTADGVHVVLESAAGEVVGERYFEPAPCADLARAAAIAIATLLEELGTEPLAAPALPSEPPIPRRRAPRPVPPKPALQLDLSLGAALLATAGDFRPGARGGAKLSAGGFGAALIAAYDAEREYDLGPGTIDWRAPFVSLLGVLRVAHAPALKLDLELGAQLSWFVIEGHGYAEDYSARGLECGPAAELELTLGAGAVRSMLNLGAVYWTREALARVDPGLQLTLPHWQGMAGLSIVFSTAL